MPHTEETQANGLNANDAIFANEDEEIPFKPVIVRAPGDTKMIPRTIY